jgi:autotransporter-associated beta strand protein
MGTKCAVVGRVCILAWLALSVGAQGAQYFDAAGGTQAWDNGITANWANAPGGPYNQFWSAGSDAVFEGTAGTVDVAGVPFNPVTANTIDFRVGGYTLNGGSLVLAGANVNVDSGTATIASNIVYDFSEAGLTKTGNGTLYLTGANDFAGMANANAGILQLSGANPVPSYAQFTINAGGTLALDTWNANPASDRWDYARIGNLITAGSIYAGGTLGFDTTKGDFNYNSNGVGTCVLRGPMALAKYGANTLTLESDNTYTGGTKVFGGILLATTPGTLPNYNQAPASGGVSIYGGGTLAVRVGGTSGFTVDQVGAMITAGDIYAGGVIGLDTTNGNFVYDGAGLNQLRGPMGLAKTGPNSLTLVGQAYGGATHIYGGSLLAATPSDLPRYGSAVTAGGVAVHSGGTLQINAGGAGEWTETEIGAFINNGDQWAGSTLAIDTTNGDFSLGATANVRGQVGVAKLGANKLTLNKAHTYEGGTVVDGGTLVQGVANAVPNGVLAVNAGGRFDLGGYDATLVSLGGLGTVGNDSVANSATLHIGSSGSDSTFAGVIEDGAGAAAGKTVSLEKIGGNTLTLAGANTYGGTTTVSEGILLAAKPAAIPNYATNLTVAPGATFGVRVGPGGWTNADVDTVASALGSGATLGIDTSAVTDPAGFVSTGISGSVGLRKLGAGKLSFSGANTYAGSTTITAGTLRVASSAQLPRYDQYVASGGVSLGAGGTLELPVGGSGWTATQIGAFVSAGDQYLGCQLALDTSAGDYSFDAANQLRGQVGLTKVGLNTLNVTAAQDYHGNTVILAGTLQAKTPACLPGYNAPVSRTPADPGQYLGIKLGTPLAGNVAATDAINRANQVTLRLNVGGAGEWTVAEIGSIISPADLWVGSTLGLDTTDGDFTYDGTGGAMIRGQASLAKFGPNTLTLATPTYRASDLDAHRPTMSVHGGTLKLADAMAAGYSVLDYDNYGGALSFGNLTTAMLGGLQGNQDLALENANSLPVALQVGSPDANGTSTYSGKLTGSGSLEKTGSQRSILTLTGANSYQGATTVSGGILDLPTTAVLPRWNQPYASGGVSIAAGAGVAVRLGGSGWSLGDVATLLGAATTVTGSELGIDTANGDYVLNVDVLASHAAMGLVKVGANKLTLGAAQTYAGATRILEGTLVVPSPSLLLNPGQRVADGGIDLEANGTLQINAGGAGEWTTSDIGAFINYGDQYFGCQLAIDTSNGDFTLDGTSNVRGQTGITKLGANKLTYATDHNYDGLTVVKAGTLEMGTGSFNNLVAHGFDIQGGKTVVDYTGTAPDVLTPLTESYDASPSWSAGPIRNTTAGITGLTLGWEDDADAQQVTIMATYAGDANLDGTVDDVDASIVGAHWHQSDCLWSQGDFNYDGLVNDRDAAILAAHWQSTVNSAETPEPSTVVLLAAGLASLLVWRKRALCSRG